jgi:hypothetical protein
MKINDFFFVEKFNFKMELSLSLVNTLMFIGSEKFADELYSDLLDQIFNGFHFSKSNDLTIDTDTKLKGNFKI